MGKNALLEIGTEEIPTSYIEPAREQLLSLVKASLDGRNAVYKDIKTYATPRRLSVMIEKLNDKTDDRTEEYFGPSVKAWKDEKGNFTPAAKGFAAKHSCPVEKLVAKQNEKGEYLCVQKKIPGEKTETILKEVFADVVGKLSFPKSMVWESSGFKFARPLRSLLALFGEKVIKFSVAGIKSGNNTTGLYIINKRKVTVVSAERYITNLRNSCVIVDPEERIEIIKKVVESTAKRAKGNALADKGLLEEVNYLIEHPVAVLGQFDEKYLKLPQEILINCMRKKQKFFSIVNDKGNLTNNFIGIRNGVSENQNIVKEGYERVLAARLADAEFFFHQDTRTQLGHKVEKLKGVVFHAKLGTVYEKMERINKLAAHINEAAGTGIDEANLQKASRLLKADLVTDMVFEYPELQGTIGRIYAEVYGEDKNISRAIEEHYWPLTTDGELPKTNIGIVLALADKIDTLAGYFAIGLIPSGSADPYGLRRISVGILRIIKERKIKIPLKDMVNAAFSSLPQELQQNLIAKDQVLDFLHQRLENMFEAEGYRFDEIRAVLACGFNDLIDVDKRLAALKAIRSMPDFAPLAAAFKRTANILKQAKKNNVYIASIVREDLFKEEAEKNIYTNICRMESDVQQLLNTQDYAAILKQMVSLKPDVDGFFDKVMVMVDDDSVRANRLAVLKYIADMFFKILDFSLLQ